MRRFFLAFLLPLALLAACESTTESVSIPETGLSVGAVAHPVGAGVSTGAPHFAPMNLVRMPLMGGKPPKALDDKHVGVVAYMLALPGVDRDKLRALVDIHAQLIPPYAAGRPVGAREAVFLLPQKKGATGYLHGSVAGMVYDYDFTQSTPLLAQVMDYRRIRSDGLYLMLTSWPRSRPPAMVHTYDITNQSPQEIADFIVQIAAGLQAGAPLPDMERALVSWRTVFTELGRKAGDLTSVFAPAGGAKG